MLSMKWGNYRIRLILKKIRFSGDLFAKSKYQWKCNVQGKADELKVGTSLFEGRTKIGREKI